MFTANRSIIHIVPCLEFFFFREIKTKDYVNGVRSFKQYYHLPIEIILFYILIKIGNIYKFPSANHVYYNNISFSKNIQFISYCKHIHKLSLHICDKFI